MDPFTQRMLERASARREKLNTMLSKDGVDVKTRRSPLRDANAILAQAPVITGHIAKSPAKITKSPVKNANSSTSPVGSPAKTPRIHSPPKKEQEMMKENGSAVKSKLQRLGKLYSDEHPDLSSPIHRTEEKFAVDDDDDIEKRSARPGARLGRLAALASEINNWEDDLSHPSVIKPPTVTKAEKIQARMNEQVKAGSEPQPSTSGYNMPGTSYSRSPVKTRSPSKWDKTVLESLGSGSSYQRSPKKSPPTATTTIAVKAPEKPVIQETKRLSTSPRALASNSTPEKATASKAVTPSTVSNTRLNSRFAFNNSPKSNPVVQSPGSVLSKASIFESKNSSLRVKDPAEMSLSERMALFEKNKGEALIPKAPLTMSVPTKMLMDREKISCHDTAGKSKIDTGKAVEAQRNIFEQGIRTQELENNILQNVQAERKRELEMLRSRFNRGRDAVQTAATSGIRTSESSEGMSSSPKYSPVCPVKPTPATDQIPPPPPLPSNQKKGFNINKTSPVKRQVVGSPPKTSNYYGPGVKVDVKRIRVSDPKPGHLYPDLDNIEQSTTETETDYTTNDTEAETATLDDPTDTETGTEAEYYLQSDNYQDYTSDDYEDDIGNTSLGRSILNIVSQHNSAHKKRSMEPDPDSTTSDISVLDEMDEYLDECLALQDNGLEGPTPPKINRSIQSPSAPSHSFRYKQGPAYHRSPVKILTPQSSPTKSSHYYVEGENSAPLMHSVSLYRKQQTQTPKTPARAVSRVPDLDDSPKNASFSDEREAVLVQDKVKRLLEDISKQQTIIGQASQALNLCTSTVEFTGSREQVEGERLLLVATQRRQAALNEIQRLKVEGTLRPVVPGAPEVQESGSLTVSAITLPLKREALRNLGIDTRVHFVCLVRHMETVLATPVIQAQTGETRITFPSTLKLQDLYSDFKITIEVYSLYTQAEILPHEVKYHIPGSSKKGAGKTPKKYLKQDNKLVMPSVQSPAGPSAVRTSSFSLAGYVVFSLKEVHRQQFTLNKIPQNSVLEGCLQMRVSCELTVSVDHHGFLTMFEDVSGFGAWHRRWCLLKGATLSYWKYPDDEKKKTPIGSLDLQTVTTTNIGLVSRDICARPNTFLLETTRPAQPDDADSLVMIRNGSETTIRHLLSADTKEDRLEWCAKLNKTLTLIRAWGATSS